MQPTDLRPLGAGEILDRAITLFVRRFGPIVAVLAVVIVPLTIVEAVVEPQSASVFGDLVHLMSSMGDPAAARHAADAMSQHDRSPATAYLLAFVAAVVRLLMWAALVRVVATAYRGEPASLGDAYRLGLRRWLPLLIVGLAFTIVGMIVAIPIVVLYVMVIFGTVAMVALHWTVPAVVLGVAGVLAVLAAAAVFESVVLMTYELASVAVVMETPSPIEAITTAIRRATARGMKRRMMIGGIVIFLVSQAGLLPVIAIAVLVSATSHVPLLYFGVFGVGSVLLDGIVASFVVVFATDVRVRREGLDLQLPEPQPVPAAT